MKNKKIRLIIAIVFVLIAALTIWYFTPTTFLSKVNPSDINLYLFLMAIQAKVLTLAIEMKYVMLQKIYKAPK